MRVLYANQTADVSGAERSLLELLRGLPADIEPAVACPEGPLAERVRALGVPWLAIPGTDASFRLHPWWTTRAVASLGRQGVAVRAAAARARPDLVHANTTRAGIAAVTAQRLGGPPVVAHIRDWVPPGRASALTLSYVCSGASLTLANSRYAAAQVPGGGAGLRVVPNPIDVDRFDAARHDRAAARARLGLRAGDEVLAVVAQLTPWKGQAEAVQALALLRARRPRARLLLVGEAKFTAGATRYDNAGYAERLRALAAGQGDAVLLLGEREDVPEVLAATDLLLVPSWREAFGRIAAEGMAMGVPVLATSAGGPAEIVRDGVDGRVLAPRDPAAWARAAEELLADPGRRAAMGRAGAARARERFSSARHGALVREAYAYALVASSATRLRSG